MKNYSIYKADIKEPILHPSALFPPWLGMILSVVE